MSRSLGKSLKPSEKRAQRWRLYTVKGPQAVDWNVPSAPMHYDVTAVGNEWPGSDNKKQLEEAYRDVLERGKQGVN